MIITTTRFIALLSLFLVLIFPVESMAEISNISSAINKAGRQRMLSQRIVATYAQIGQDIQTKKSKKQLLNAIMLFDKQLAELKYFRNTGKINAQLQEVSKVWLPVKQIASKPIQRSRAENLRRLAEKVLRESHRVVIMLQDESNSKKGRLVNISGRQRMLSQRLANLYTLQSWGFTSSEYSGDYSIALNEYKGALNELMSSKLNTDEINLNLKKASTEFKMFKRSSHHKNDKFIPLMVKMSADKLLKIMNKVTHLYENLKN